MASTISNIGDGIGLIAYPWLASAVTRNPILIALVAVVQRLPWLVFSLPAGVITDRVNRRTLMVRANAVRAVLTIGVAFLVLNRQSSLPGPDEVAAATGALDTDLVLYGVVLLATGLLGVAEVLYDNAGQTFMPAIVAPANLEKANGRLWSIESVANTFMGPPLGALLLVLAFSVPFFVDAVTFALSAVLITMIPASRTAPKPAGTEAKSWREDLVEGFRWLWGHELLRPMAIILGLLNMLFTMSGATLVLFAQEVLKTDATEFAILGTGGAVGGVLGGWTGSWVASKIGSGPSLALTLIGGGTTSIIIGFASSWPLVWVMTSISMFVAVLWNVITVSLRQTIIPDHLLGRVNSVYRFFAWGMMPIGAFLGGVVVLVTEATASRELALRMPWFFAGVAQFVLLVGVTRLLTTDKIESARAGGN
nr:putative MFS transporter [uncultured bacterium]